MEDPTEGLQGHRAATGTRRSEHWLAWPQNLHRACQCSSRMDCV